MSVGDSLSRLESLLEDIRTRLEGLEERMRPDAACLSVKDAAAHLGVSATVVKEMIARRELHTATIGRRSMVPLSELTRVSTPDATRPAQAKKTQRAAWVPLKKRG